MNEAARFLLFELGRTTLALAAAAMLVALLLRSLGVRSPTMSRFAWCIVLLVGWCVLRVPVFVPWYAAVPDVAVAGDSAPLAEMPPPLGAGGEPESGAALPMPSGGAANGAPGATLTETTRAFALSNWPAIMAGIWLVGLMASVALPVIDYVRFLRGLPESDPAGEEWDRQWQQLLREKGIEREISLRITRATGPLLCRLPSGYRLYVSQDLWVRLGVREREAILRHELAHYLRGDLWKSVAVRGLALPHWFNPAAWWAVRRFDQAAEWACDAAALKSGPLNPSQFASVLLQLGQSRSATRLHAHAARGRELPQRIRRLLKDQHGEDSTMKKTCIVTVGCAIAMIALIRVELVSQAAEGEGQQQFALAPQQEKAAQADSEGASSTGRRQRATAHRARLLEHVKTAAKAYEAYEAAYEANTVTLPGMYNWSRRWLDAELKAAQDRPDRVQATQAHLIRMQKLHAEIAKRFAEGAFGGEAEKYYASKFYMQEAAIWLLEIEQSKAQPSERETSSTGQQQVSGQARDAVLHTWRSVREGTPKLRIVLDGPFVDRRRIPINQIKADLVALDWIALETESTYGVGKVLMAFDCLGEMDESRSIAIGLTLWDADGDTVHSDRIVARDARLLAGKPFPIGSFIGVTSRRNHEGFRIDVEKVQQAERIEVCFATTTEQRKGRSHY